MKVFITIILTAISSVLFSQTHTFEVTGGTKIHCKILQETDDIYHLKVLNEANGFWNKRSILKSDVLKVEPFVKKDFKTSRKSKPLITQQSIGEKHPDLT
jgi:hypothetical protein